MAIDKVAVNKTISQRAGGVAIGAGLGTFWALSLLSQGDLGSAFAGAMVLVVVMPAMAALGGVMGVGTHAEYVFEAPSPPVVEADTAHPER
jgi:hypothetical protein